MKKIIAAVILIVTSLLLVAEYSQAADITRQSILIETNPLKVNLKKTTNDLKDKQLSMAFTSYMSQPTTYQWGYTYNCIYNNASFTATIDGGFAIAGDSGGAINLVKVDSNGNTIWIQNYSSSGRYITNSVQQTMDNGYIMAGIHENGTTFEVFILKVDSLGLINWYTTFPADNVSADVKQTLSGGYAVLGTVNNSVKLLVLDSAGNTLWSTVFKNYSAWETGKKVLVEKVNGYIDILTRGQNSPSSSGYSALYKYQPTGNLLAKISYYDYSEISAVKTFLHTRDFNYVLVGDYADNIRGVYNHETGMSLAKLSNSFNFTKSWIKLYPFYGDMNNFMSSDSLAETPSGNFALLGHLMLNCGSPAFNMDTALVGADNNGYSQWSLSLDIAPREYPCFVHSTSDGSYFIGGCLTTASGFNYAYLVKLK